MQVQIQNLTGHSTFVNVLPLEVRANVYKKIEYNDVLSMRLVSKTIKNEIDEFIDLHIVLDQTYRRFRQLCKLRVKSIKVDHLDRKINSKLKFTHAEKIKKIIFDGPVSPTNLRKILSECDHVQHLCFTHQTLRSDYLFKSDGLLKSFQQLHFVTNLNLQLLRYPMADPFDEGNNISFFLKHTFPFLTTFKLYYSLLGKWKELLLFLQKHAETLKVLELQVGDRADLIATQYYLVEYPSANVQSEIDMNQLRKMQLTDFRFRDDVLFANNPIKQIIFDIVSAQTRMEVFQFHSSAEVSIKCLKELVQVNASTISDIHIDYLKCNQRNDVVLINSLFVDRYKIVDLKMFSPCKRLKCLSLSRSPPRSLNPNQDEGIPFVLTNFSALSPSLEKLHLRGFTLQQDDIINFTHKSPKLREVVIEDCGRIKYSTLINNFLKNCPKLQIFSVRPVIARGSSDSSWFSELSSLNRVFTFFMKIPFNIDDLDGFEARICDEDRTWISANC